VASSKKNISLRLCVFYTAITFFTVSANAAKPAPEDLVERFVSASKQMSQEYFAANVKNYQSLIDCLSDENHCEKAEVLSEQNGEAIKLTFSQDDLLDFLTIRLKEYRILVGLSLYPALQAGLAVGRGRVTLTPLQRGLASPVIYDTRNAEGMEEFKRIEHFYEQQKEDIGAFNKWLTHARFDDGVVKYNSIVHFANKNIAQFLKSYPFLAKMLKADSSKKAFIAALSKIRDDFQSTERHIASLEGEKRKEVFGFISVLKDVLQTFTQAEQDAIVEHFHYLAESTNFWTKLKGIITLKWVITVGCFAAAIPAPVLLAVCYAMGLTLAVPVIFDVAKQTKRLLRYYNTGQFDEDILHKIMMSNMVSMVMMGVYLKAAVPSFTVSISTFRASSQSLLSSVKLKGLRFIKFNKDLLKETGDILLGSAKFNAKEAGLELGMNEFASALNLVVPLGVAAFTNGLDKPRSSYGGARVNGFFSFSNLLSVRKDLMIGL